MRGTSHKKHSGSKKPLPVIGARAARRPSSVNVILLLGVLWTLGGCKVGPNFTTPTAKVNKSWSAAESPQISTQTATDQQWWKTFHDEALNRLVELAYRQNLPLQMAGLR